MAGIYQKTAQINRRKSGLPSSKLIIILENRDYIAIMKEKLNEIKLCLKQKSFDLPNFM